MDTRPWTWPLVAANDDGIRPGGACDECFYCKRHVGQPHGDECVIVTQKWRVAFTVELDVDAPYCWDRADIEHRYSGGTGSGPGALKRLRELVEAENDLDRLLYRSGPSLPEMNRQFPMESYMSFAPTPHPATYSTAELERLTTLTPTKLRNGEYFCWTGGDKAMFQTARGPVHESGLGAQLNPSIVWRRIRSFTDRTEIDPPQAAMERELARRRLAATFAHGERVRCDAYFGEGVVEAQTADPRNVLVVYTTPRRLAGPTINKYFVAPNDVQRLPALRFRRWDVVVCENGWAFSHGSKGTPCLATLKEDCAMPDPYVYVTWDRRTGQTVDDGGWVATHFRLATTADIAAFEARIPKAAPSFKEGDLVENATHPWGRAYPIARFDSVTQVSLSIGPSSHVGGPYNVAALRPATDAEVAAYHRQHCGAQDALARKAERECVEAAWPLGTLFRTPSSRQVKEVTGYAESGGNGLWPKTADGTRYNPCTMERIVPRISNATHAGQRVRADNQEYVVVTSWVNEMISLGSAMPLLPDEVRVLHTKSGGTSTFLASRLELL